MGVACGRLVAAPAYSSIQPQVVSAGEDQVSLNLTARLSNGQILDAIGVYIADYSAELGLEGLEVSVLGIAYPLYEDLFPNHVAAYKHPFPAKRPTSRPSGCTHCALPNSSVNPLGIWTRIRQRLALLR